MFTNSTSKYYILIGIGLLSLWSCEKTGGEEPVSEETRPLFEVPANFGEPVYDMSSKPVTEAGFQLGRKLFYDGRLSRDGTISCAECHNQPYAFTHHGHIVSHGIDNRVGKRNAPPIQNTAWMSSFFWDGGVFDLDLFSPAPITNPLEMDETMTNVIDKVAADTTYRSMFKEAYGSEEVNTSRFLRALSQFMNALVSSNSKYDKYVRNEPGGELSADELEGLRLFENKCSSCHSGFLFSDQSFRNNGLEPFRTDPDLGRALVTEQETDKFKFKVPSLRNVRFTAPYMHDGRFSSLEQVLDHYAGEVMDTQNLDPLLKDSDGTLGISMTEKEKTQIISFLKTLSDEEFIRDSRFSAP